MQRVINVSDRVSRISTRDRQVLFEFFDESPSQSVPAEDIGMLILDTGRASVTTSALRRLADQGAVIVLTDERHLPCALMLPHAGHSESTRRLWTQINTSIPRRKQAWKQIVIAKIEAQARNCTHSPDAKQRLHIIAGKVRSGDPENREGTAAALYWPAYSGDPEFRRTPREGAPPNNLLDYGYSIVRAACARALVQSGLHPALGVNHHGRSNPYCLADDLMEPLRPIVDHIAFKLHRDGIRDLDSDSRYELIRVLTRPVRTSNGTGTLDAAIIRYAASLATFLERESDQLDIPTER